MVRFSAHDAKQNFGKLISAARHAPVFIRKYNRDVAVVMSPQKYRRLTRFERKAFKYEFAEIISDIERTSGAETDAATLRLAKLLSRMPAEFEI